MRSSSVQQQNASADGTREQEAEAQGYRESALARPGRVRTGLVWVNGCDRVLQDERRVVYVGRICGSMTPDELRERFLQFGQVECVSLHFRETGFVCTSFFTGELGVRLTECFRS